MMRTVLERRFSSCRREKEEKRKERGEKKGRTICLKFGRAIVVFYSRKKDELTNLEII